MSDALKRNEKIERKLYAEDEGIRKFYIVRFSSGEYTEEEQRLIDQAKRAGKSVVHLPPRNTNGQRAGESG
jgi:hypothetical protein